MPSIYRQVFHLSNYWILWRRHLVIILCTGFGSYRNNWIDGENTRDVYCSISGASSYGKTLLAALLNPLVWISHFCDNAGIGLGYCRFNSQSASRVEWTTFIWFMGVSENLQADNSERLDC